MVWIGAAWLAWAPTAWAQANLFVPDVTIAFEDVTDAPDRDNNDVVVRANRACRFDAGGLLVGDTIRLTGLAAGAARVNAVRLAVPAAPTTATLRRGEGAPQAGALDGDGRLRLWDDFAAEAFGPSTGFVNTTGDAVVAGVPLRVDLAYSPGVDTGGRCPAVDLVLVRADATIDAASTLPSNGQPLVGRFPGAWSVPVETTPIEQAYPEFLAWLDDRAEGCVNGCSNEDWFFHPNAPDVIARADLDATAPLARPETCADGVQNQDETGVDCGGAVCGPCPASAGDHCRDGVRNVDEDGVDCGGADCFECVVDCDGDPIANPALEILRFEGVVQSVSGPSAVPGPGVGEALEGWVAWDRAHAVDVETASDDLGRYCYGDLPGEFQMVFRSPTDCWESIDWGFGAADGWSCHFAYDDLPAGPYGPGDWTEWFSWELGPSGDAAWGLGSVQIRGDEASTYADASARASIPPLSTFEHKAIYLELYDANGDWRGFEASLDALRGNLVEPEPEPSATTWFYGNATVGGLSTAWRMGDVNGDGDALDPGETVAVHAFGANVPYGVAGPDGALYAMTSAGAIQRLFDADGDGAFGASEIASFADASALSARRDLAFGPSGDLYVSSLNSGVQRYRDGNGDHDALDPGESVQFGTIGASQIDVVAHPTLGRDVVWGQYYEIVRYEDTNGDGDATDAGESGYKGFRAPGCSGGLARGVAVHPLDGLVYGLHQNSGSCPNEVARFQDGNGDGDFYDAGESTLVGTYTANQSYTIAFAPDGTLLATSHEDAGSVYRLVDANTDGVFEKIPWAVGVQGLQALHAGPELP